MDVWRVVTCYKNGETKLWEGVEAKQKEGKGMSFKYRLSGKRNNKVSPTG